uniref:Reverse transcriptase domain-containing protein n=1 Tax=Nothobranchius furzeri TaxID=105023 RepID=A0A8C6PVC2_NOTFU
NSDTIPVIKQGDEEMFTAKGINNIFQQYYKKLSHLQSWLKSHEAEGLDLPITEAEIRKAIASMKNGKSPGYDGLPVEYYKTFADIAAPILHEVYQEMFDKGCVAPTFNEAVISLIFKTGKDPNDPSSYRPISLLNLDCKILTKILATRLQLVLPNIIHPNQVGLMKNRTLTDNVRLLLHLMWLSQSQDVPIAALSLDDEKAFDRVEWQFLLSILSHFGFTADFIKWITIPLLFIIFLEVLAVSIRAHKGIKGIRVGVVSEPLKSLPHLMDAIQSFSKLPGYSINCLYMFTNGCIPLLTWGWGVGGVYNQDIPGEVLRNEKKTHKSKTDI